MPESISMDHLIRSKYLHSDALHNIHSSKGSQRLGVESANEGWLIRCPCRQSQGSMYVCHSYHLICIMHYLDSVLISNFQGLDGVSPMDYSIG